MRAGEGKGFVEWTSGMRQVSFCLELPTRGESVGSAPRPAGCGVTCTLQHVSRQKLLSIVGCDLCVKLHQLYPDSQMIDTFFRICVKTGKNDEADDCWTVNHYPHVSQPQVGAFTFQDHQKTAQED